MTLQRIDAELEAWDGRLAAIADNLLWLQSDSTYLSLKGAGSQAQAAGKTAQCAEQALGAVPSIFDRFNLLHSTINRAKKLREALPAIFGSEQKAAEIERLLYGRSIQLPAAVGSGQRSLLSGARGSDCVAPAELLDAMVKAFAAARDAVLAVEHAWRDLAEGIDQAETVVQRCRQQAAEPDCQLSPEIRSALGAIEGKLRAIRACVASDPLGALDTLKQDVEPALAHFARTAEAAAKIKDELLQAHAQFDELTALHRESLAMVAEAQGSIADPELAPPVAEERLERLRDWLDQLDHRQREGGPAALESGMKHWRGRADECVAEERRAIAANRGQLDLRRELRGRLDALKAKARARGVVEHAEIAQLAEQARQLLAVRPTDLKKAAETVAAYADAVNAAGIGSAKAAAATAAEVLRAEKDV
jgi:hypothetical protein